MAWKPSSSGPAFRESQPDPGLGTILVFILLALVASVATGVLVQTIGLIGQTTDEPTSVTTATEAPPIDVVEKTGHVTADRPPMVETIVLTVQRGSAHEPLNLADASVDWFGPTGHTTLTYGATTDTARLAQPATAFAVGTEHDADGSRPRLNAAEDRLTIVINGAAITGERGLAPGTTVAIRLTTPNEAMHFLTIDVPETLAQESTVSL